MPWLIASSGLPSAERPRRSSRPSLLTSATSKVCPGPTGFDSDVNLPSASLSQTDVPNTRSSPPLLSRSATRRLTLFTSGAFAISSVSQPAPWSLSDTRLIEPPGSTTKRSKTPSSFRSATLIARAPLLGTARSENCPCRSLLKTCSFPAPSISAASGSPSASRSAQAKPVIPEMPPKGWVSRNVSSPLFLKTVGTPSVAPRIRSRSPSASMSAAHAAVYLRLVTVAGRAVLAVTSVNAEGLSWRNKRTPPSPASTRSVLKS